MPLTFSNVHGQYRPTWAPLNELPFKGEAGLLEQVLRRACLALGIVALAAADASADEMQCPGAPTSVISPTKDLAARICAAAIWAEAFFVRCGLVQERTLSIDVVDRLTHPLGLPVIATFDATKWKIQISTYEAVQSIILPGSVYRMLPPRDVYDSLVVHEVAHAIFREHVHDLNIPVSAHEYVAYAIQIASLPPEARDTFLLGFPRQTPSGFGIFNEVYLAMGPLRFGANAYRHLFKDNMSCQTIRRIAAGEADFPLPLE
ncbi:MAG: hypothetical protein H6876_05000 [Hyphomicrobiaceae bacterium]|nr:hypothetical protein [Hyphomicrobiaceae bacterium]MCC0007467.1 hypothetical protein [Hyphomicrobiaceae bacterium]